MMYFFGPFLIDSLQRQLFHLGTATPLNPKAFDVLFYLAGNPGKIITKSELLNAAWPGTSVAESNLTQTIFLLRNVLKTCDSGRYIITVPGQGYQFAATVNHHSESSDNGDRSVPQLNASGNNGTSPVYGWLSNRTPRSLDKAVLWCQRKTLKDPASGPTYVDLANAYCLQMTLGDIAPRQALVRIEHAVIRALEAGAHAAFAPLGFVRCHFDRDWQAADRDFQHALDKCPDDLMAHHWYGEFLAARGRFDESLNMFWRAQKKDPRSLLIQTDIALTLFWARDYKECEKQALKVRDLAPLYPRTNVILGSAYRFQGRYGEAIRTLERITSGKPRVVALTLLADAYAWAGETRKLNTTWNSLKRLNALRFISPYAMAFVLASRGQTTRCFQMLNRAAEEIDYWLLWLKVKPNLDPIRRDARFDKLLQASRLASI